MKEKKRKRDTREFKPGPRLIYVDDRGKGLADKITYREG